MSKKSWIIVAAAAIAIVAVAAAVFVTSREPSTPTTTTTGTPSTSATATSSTTTTGSSAPSQVGTVTPNGVTGAIGTTNGAVPPVTELGPFPYLPEPKGPATSPTTPIAKGATLGTLKHAPANTISALQDGAVPNRTKYTVVLSPYGIGPTSPLGSRIAVRVGTTNPKSKYISNVNLLVVVDTVHGGTITKGGTYTAVITMVSDGTKLVPILSAVKAQ